MQTLAPIILFTYNRPWHAEQTLVALSKNDLANESTLYIYCDGAKEDASIEQKLEIEKVRAVVRKQKWCKEVHVIESDKNKGLANSIISGVSEVIMKHGKVIVLEDDLVTSPYFLNYMNKALEYYESYPAVFSIGANRPPLDKMQIPNDYKFDVFACLRSYSTGWGTWKNRWERIDWQLDKYNACKLNPFMLSALNRLGDDFSPMLQLQEDGKIDSWAVRFGFAHFMHHAVAILPCNSYVTNIGFDGTGTHSGLVEHIYENDLSKSVANPVFLDVVYEDKRIINAFYNSYCAEKRPLWQKIINRISRMLGGKNVFVIKKKIYA